MIYCLLIWVNKFSLWTGPSSHFHQPWSSCSEMCTILPLDVLICPFPTAKQWWFSSCGTYFQITTCHELNAREETHLISWNTHMGRPLKWSSPSRPILYWVFDFIDLFTLPTRKSSQNELIWRGRGEKILRKKIFQKCFESSRKEKTNWLLKNHKHSCAMGF